MESMVHPITCQQVDVKKIHWACCVLNTQHSDIRMRKQEIANANYLPRIRDQLFENVEITSGLTRTPCTDTSPCGSNIIKANFLLAPNFWQEQLMTWNRALIQHGTVTTANTNRKTCRSEHLHCDCEFQNINQDVTGSQSHVWIRPEPSVCRSHEEVTLLPTPVWKGNKSPLHLHVAVCQPDIVRIQN